VFLMKRSGRPGRLYSFICSTNMLRNKIKILSLDPGTKHLGFAFFENDDLVDYGVKTIRQGSSNIILRHIDEICDRWARTIKPDFLVLEKNQFSQIQTNLRLMLAISRLKKSARRNGIPCYEFDPKTIRKAICNDGNATKKRVAEVLVTYFPELVPYIKSDKEWKIKYHQNMFDAVAVGMVFIKQHINSSQRFWQLFWRKKS